MSTEPSESQPRDWDAGLAELLDDEPDRELGRPVDDPAVSAPVVRSTVRKPVLPAWLRSWSTFLDTLWWTLGYGWHTFAFHFVRTPWYGLKLVGRSPVGFGRSLRSWWRWSWDSEGHQVRQAAVRREDATEYLKLSAQRDNRVRLRVGMQLPLVPVFCCVSYLVLKLSLTERIGLLLVLALLFGCFGSPADKPLLSTAVVSHRVPRLHAEAIVEALAALGIAGITSKLAKNPKAIQFPDPIARDGAGWRAVIDLPTGVTADEVIERREKLAGGLARPLGCVWPESAPKIHPGRLILWVGDRDVATAKQPAWPLLKAGSVDLFKSWPFGISPRGQVVNVTLMFASVVIGAIPRMGKTFAMRLMLLAAALDPRAQLHPYDLKGTGDFSVLEPVAHRYRSGDDEDDIEYALADLREQQKELRRRAKVIRELPRDLCPENKVTPELASDKRFGLHPIVIAVDECQRWFEHPDYGKELQAICEDLVRRGPALGICAAFATQRVDAKSLPTGISSNAVLRLCLKVIGYVANDQVLGTGAHQAGVKATMFARSDKGMGYLSGEADDPQIVRSYRIDGPQAEQVVARAYAVRKAAGRLTGHALGHAPAVQSGPSILDDLLAVWPDGERKAWNDLLCERLATLRPDTYQGWESEQLTAALKPHKTVRVHDVGRRINGQAHTRRGIGYDDLTAAIATQRDRKSGTD